MKVLSELVGDKHDGSDGDATDLQVEMAHHHLSLVQHGLSTASKDQASTVGVQFQAKAQEGAGEYFTEEDD